MMDKIKEKLEGYTAKPLGVTKHYAVLLPLIWENDEWQVLYQIRSYTISQPGEVAFPGGRVEAGEAFSQAAVRETIEELNLSADVIELVGEIDYFVYQDREIHCFIGHLMIENWRAITPNNEVERLFTIPLRQLLETAPTYYKLKADFRKDSDFPFERINQGENYRFGHQNRKIPFYEHVGENLWGMTAQFTNRFVEILQGK
nr:CoA pyrophosphatase [Streptococcus sp. S784/96/1]